MWQQRCSKYYFKCNILNITRLRWKEQGAAVNGRDDSRNGVTSQQRQARAQAMVAEAEAVKGQTTINNQPKSGRNISRIGPGGGGGQR
jgi:hypothetical protein